MAISNYSVVGLNLGEIRSNIKSFSDNSILVYEVALNSDLHLGVNHTTRSNLYALAVVIVDLFLKVHYSE